MFDSPKYLRHMPEIYTETLILGAGISGLSAGYHLNKEDRNFLILDQNAAPGGVMRSIQKEGYTLDLAANSFAFTPEIKSLIQELGLEGKKLKATFVKSWTLLVLI